MLKRIGLFVITNLLVVLTISIILSLLGVGGYMGKNGIDYQALAIFCLVWGMVGSFISLQMSRFMAKRMLGVQVIQPGMGGKADEVYNMVAQLSKAAGLPVVPEVGIYESPEVNAFATGPSKRRALVAFSTGILHNMSRQELEGVTAHEIAHIANGDMVTMTLLQGIVNAFVMFLARVIAFAITNFGNRSSDGEERGAGSYFMQSMLVMVLESVLMLLGYIVIAWFSRQREFRADAGSARIAGREKMIAALQRLRSIHDHPEAIDAEHASLATMKISGKATSLFSTHPPLEARIAALENYRG